MSVAPSKKSTLATVPSESAAVAVMVMLAGALNTALFAGAVMLTVGTASTRIVTAAEVVLKPRLSVARAVSACVPAARLARVTLKGAAVAVPASVEPSKKSTLATVPSASEALAVIVTFAGGRKTALLAGAVRLTAGAVSTVTLTAVEVVAMPLLSVAVAARARFEPGANTALFAGAPRLTVGGTSTVMLTALEVAVAPALSVALAVRL